MQYRRDWNGTTEITVGNTVRAAETEPEQRRDAKIIQADTFTAKHLNVVRERQRAAERYRREKEVEMIRLTLQAICLLAMFFMICLVDAVGILGTVMLVAGIISCAAIMILLGDDKKEH